MTVNTISVENFDLSNVYSGSVDITPKFPVPLGGYAGRPRKSHIGSEKIEANWIAFRNKENQLIVVLAIDALFSSTRFEALLRKSLKALKISVGHLWCVASHTHFAPQFDPKLHRVGGVDERHLADVVGYISESIASAFFGSSRSVCGMLFGSSNIQGTVYRRRFGAKLTRKPPFFEIGTIMAPNPKVEIPTNLRIWGLHDLHEEVIAWIVHWPCHAVSAPSFQYVSASHVGAIREVIRSNSKDQNSPIIYMPGCCGDIRPDIRASFWSLRGLVPVPFQPSFASTTASSFSKQKDMIRASTVEAISNLEAIGSETNCVVSVTSDDLFSTASLIVNSVRLGPVTFIGMNAEVCHGWVKAVGQSNESKSVALTGCVGDVFGYMPTPTQIEEGGYEVEGFSWAFDFMERWNTVKNYNQRVVNLIDVTLTIK